MEPCETPARVSTQEESGHLKLPFVFCWSRNHLVY